MTDTPQDPNDWTGQSLGFINRMIGGRGKFASCKDAIAHTYLFTKNLDNPPVRALVWFDNDPYGDVGLSVGGGRMLAVAQGGLPAVVHVSAWRREPVGWSYLIGDKP